MSSRPKGTHIITGGFEYDRIMEPFFGEYPVENVVILRGDTPYKETYKQISHFVDKIEENVPKEVEIVHVDMYDFNSVFQETLNLIEKYSGNNSPIYLNISSAPKLTLAAMMSATYFSRKEAEIEAFYVAPKEYLPHKIYRLLDQLDSGDNQDTVEELKDIRDKFKEHGEGQGVKNYEVIPLFPIEDINDLDTEILKVLEQNKGIESISKLTEQLKTEEERKRSTIQYRLEKLEEKNLIEKIKGEGQVGINITRLGEIYLKSKKQ